MKIIFSLYLVFYAIFSFSGGIDKGYDALKMYNYFEAKNRFESNLKKDSVACSYGLAVIYFRKDNPFHDYKLAKSNFEVCIRNLPNYSPKDLNKLNKLGIDSVAIDTLKNALSAYFFHLARHEQDYQPFLNQFKWAQEYDSAVYLLDELFFEAAIEENSSESFLKFIGFYPESAFLAQAHKRYNRLLYLESTTRLTALSYVNFIRNHPESPFVDEAEDEIYKINTQDRSVQSYTFFIQNFPSNRNLFDAWRKLSKAYLFSFTEERYNSFKQDFPDYPFMGELEVELSLSRIVYLPYLKYEKWGFIDTLGFVRVPVEYESVEKFKEGYSVVKMEDKFGAINKKGDLVIPMIYDEFYDFHEGLAIVSIEGLYGMVNRAGELVLQIEYEDISEMVEGLAKAEKDGLYGFYDQNGFERIESIYEEAENFNKGKSIVSLNGKYGVIDKYGVVLIDFKYDDLIYYTETLLAAETENGWGIISFEKDTILDFEMDLIRPLYNGYGYFEYENKFGFLNENGRIYIEATFDVFADDKQLCYFKNGHALVKNQGKFGLINEKGKKVIPSIFNGIGYFNDLIPIKKEDKWGYCDEKANRKIDYKYDYASNFMNLVAIVELDSKIGMINKKGDFILNPEFEEITILDSNYVKVKKNEKYGLYSQTGTQIIPIENDELNFYSNVLIAVINAGELNYFNLKSNAYIEIE